MLSLSARAIVPATLLISCSASAAELYANNFDGQALGALNGQSAFVPGFPAVSWPSNGDVTVSDGAQGPQPYSGYSVNMRSAIRAARSSSAGPRPSASNSTLPRICPATADASVKSRSSIGPETFA